MLKDPYWRIFAEEATSDIGIQLTNEQVDKLEDALVGAHENYRLGNGLEVAKANWRAQEDRNLINRGKQEVIRFIKERVSIIDGGPNFFNSMSREQKLAMHEIFQAEDFV